MSDINLDELTKAEDITGQFDSKDIEENKTMAILAYLSVLVIVPLVMARESKFAMFHANQGIVLAVIEVIASVLMGVLGWLPGIGFVVRIVISLIGLVCLVLLVMGLLAAVNGQAKKLPVVGNFTFIK